MIDFYCWDTPNCEKVAVALAEMGLAYQIVPVDLESGQQFTPEFVSVNPNNKVPAIIDSDGPGGKSIRIFESGAILLYIAERSNRFIPSDPQARSSVVQWLFWQTSGFGPMLGQAEHFLNGGGKKAPYAAERFTKESHRLWRVLENRLSESEFVATKEFTIADMAVFPWAQSSHKVLRLDWSTYPNTRRWYQAISKRAAVREAMRRMRTI